MHFRRVHRPFKTLNSIRLLFSLFSLLVASFVEQKKKKLKNHVILGGLIYAFGMYLHVICNLFIGLGEMNQIPCEKLKFVWPYRLILGSFS